jgi:hypothetical protein
MVFLIFFLGGGKQVRTLMREMDAQHRSALHEQKAALEFAHAKALAYARAADEQASYLYLLVCVCVCLSACMYVCMYVCMYI